MTSLDVESAIFSPSQNRAALGHCSALRLNRAETERHGKGKQGGRRRQALSDVDKLSALSQQDGMLQPYAIKHRGMT